MSANEHVDFNNATSNEHEEDDLKSVVNAGNDSSMEEEFTICTCSHRNLVVDGVYMRFKSDWPKRQFYGLQP